MPAAKKQIDPTDVGKEFAQVLEDAARVAEETNELVEAINAKRLPVASLKLLADDLQRRMAEIDLRKERLETLHLAQTIAYRQRTGEEPAPGTQLTGEDVRQAERIARGLLAKVPEGPKN
jgi:septal ring factor EnvC (AmiA/AmiB activator)